MSAEVNLLDLIPAELILGEIIVLVLFGVGCIFLYNYVSKKAFNKGVEHEKNENTSDVLREHLADCSKKNKAVDDRLDKVDQELVGLKTKVDMIYDKVCDKNEK